jgi:hypothetical protein
VKPNSLLCQLSQLYKNSTNELVWKEISRSLKFIEYVEESGRWSRPYVATLSLHSLIELRKYISNGYVNLDFKGKNYRTLVGK